MQKMQQNDRVLFNKKPLRFKKDRFFLDSNRFFNEKDVRELTTEAHITKSVISIFFWKNVK